MYQGDERKTVDRNLRLCTTDDEPQSQTDGYQSGERVCMFVMLLFSWLLFGFLRLNFAILPGLISVFPAHAILLPHFQWCDCRMGPHALWWNRALLCHHASQPMCLAVSLCLALAPWFAVLSCLIVFLPCIATTPCDATVPWSVPVPCQPLEACLKDVSFSSSCTNLFTLT